MTAPVLWLGLLVVLAAVAYLCIAPELGDKNPTTNAKWTRPATRPLTKTGHASAWARMRKWSRVGIRAAVLYPAVGFAYGLVADRTVTVYCAAVFAGVAGGTGVAWCWLRITTRSHRRDNVIPLRDALTAKLGVPPTRLYVAPDLEEVTVGVPHTFTGAETELTVIEQIVKTKLQMAAPERKTMLRGRNPSVTLTESRPPPPEVLPHHVMAAIQAAEEHEIVHGLGKKGVTVIRSIDQDSPHIAHCMPSGDGKSYALMNIGAQHLYHGGVLIILDIKMLSHMWADGLPNVCYAYTPEMVHTALCWLACDDDQESELTYRKRIGRAHADIRGRIQTDIGPRLLVALEEANDTQKALKGVWRKMGGKGPSPAAEALDTLSFTGRALKCHVDYVAQRLSAKASSGGGSADSRENIGLTVFSNPKDSTWRMLGEGHAKPPSSDHKGRYQMLDRKGLTPFQGVLWTPEQAREFAMSGTVAQPHRDLPFTRHGALVTGQTAIETGGSDLGIVERQVPVLARPPGTATIKEFAVAARCTEGAARKRVQRATLAAAGTEGKENLYRLDDLKELVR